MKNIKYKILVLSDLNETTSNTLVSSVSLAKIVNADINFLYVKKPTEVVKKESQLSAMRNINKEYFSTDKTIKNLIAPIYKDYNLQINHTFKIGNLKSELGHYIDENKPDIIILGKRKNKIINFMGDNITEFILKKHKGTIIITDDANPLKPNKELSLGLFNNTSAKSKFTESIINASKKPLTSFKISENSLNKEEEPILKDKKTIEYVFKKGDNAIKNISNYVTKSNVNLLFVQRGKDNNNNVNIKEVIKKFNCSLILTT